MEESCACLRLNQGALGVFFDENVVSAICKVWWRIKEHLFVSLKLDESE